MAMRPALCFIIHLLIKKEGYETSPHLSPDVVDEEEGGVGADPEECAAAERLLGRPVLPVRRGVAPADVETAKKGRAITTCDPPAQPRTNPVFTCRAAFRPRGGTRGRGRRRRPARWGRAARPCRRSPRPRRGSGLQERGKEEIRDAC